MIQPDLFENAAKEHGMAYASQGHEAQIATCRYVAIKLLAIRGEITIDDLREALPNMVWGNWNGSIFKDKRFVFSGYKPATHSGSHGRPVGCWKLREAT